MLGDDFYDSVAKVAEAFICFSGLPKLSAMPLLTEFTLTGFQPGYSL